MADYVTSTWNVLAETCKGSPAWWEGCVNNTIHETRDQDWGEYPASCANKVYEGLPQPADNYKLCMYG